MLSPPETFSGKSALCIGLGVRFRKDGIKAGYMKPVNVNSQLRDGQPYDEDVVFARQIFDMKEPAEQIGPVAFTPTRLEQQLRGTEINYEPHFMEAFTQLSANRDLMVLEGGRSWREGYVAGISAKRVVELTRARVVIVLKYEGMLLVDRALAAQDYFGDALVGVVVNETPRSYLENMRGVMEPYLLRHNLNVLGILPKDPRLAAPTVADLISLDRPFPDVRSGTLIDGVAGPPDAPSGLTATQPGTKNTGPVVLSCTDNAPSLPNPPLSLNSQTACFL